MYKKPSLERFGSFRELTRGGSFPASGDTTGNWFADLITGPTSS
jgi:hypothetical protein